MKKIITVAAMALARTAMAVPAHADNDANFGSGVNAANNWNFTAADVCMQELAVVPALSDWTGNHKNNCSNGNVIDHSAGNRPPSGHRRLSGRARTTPAARSANWPTRDRPEVRWTRSRSSPAVP